MSHHPYRYTSSRKSILSESLFLSYFQHRIPAFYECPDGHECKREESIPAIHYSLQRSLPPGGLANLHPLLIVVRKVDALVWLSLVRPGHGSNAGIRAENWLFSTNPSSQDLRLPAATEWFSSVSSSMSRCRDTINGSKALPTSTTKIRCTELYQKIFRRNLFADAAGRGQAYD